MHPVSHSIYSFDGAYVYYHNVDGNVRCDEAESSCFLSIISGIIFTYAYRAELHSMESKGTI